MSDETDTCCPPDCCDMRGLLTFQILWELRSSELNGKQIADRIGARRGTIPTPGTLYPALKEMREKGLIEGRGDGREVIYGLTGLGRAGLSDAARYFCQVFGDIVDEYRKGSFSSAVCKKC